MSEFKPGDVVVLKSGGPLMTVAAVEGVVVSCQWFHEEDVKSKDFLAAVLQKG